MRKWFLFQKYASKITNSFGQKNCLKKLFLVTLTLLICEKSLAKVEVDITRGVFEPFSIAIADFEASNIQSIEFGTKIKEVIQSDLANSKIFKLVDNSLFLEFTSFSNTPVFQN